MFETIIAIIMSFVGTNIDDIFINTLFFAQADTKRKKNSVIVGKYLGTGSLVLVSCLGASVLHVVPQKYIGFFGFVPIGLGIKEWINYIKNKKQSFSDGFEEKQDISGELILNVTLVTMSNGADNIGVYVPLFSGYTIFQMIAVFIIFALMIALWCILGKKLSDLPGLRDFLLKYKYIIVPVVFVMLGIYIIMKSM